MEMSDSFWRVMLMGTLFSLNTSMYAINQAIGKARTDLWLSVLAGAIPAAVGVWLLFGTARRYPDRSLMEELAHRHPFAGRLITALYLLFFFLMMVRDFRMTNDLINMVLLPYTPAEVILIISVATAILIARNPSEVVIRINQLGQPVFLAASAFVILMLANRFDLSNFFPMFESGVVPPLEGGWYFFAYFGEIVALPFVFAGRELTALRGWVSLLVTVILLELIGFTMIAVLGIHIPTMLQYPVFNLVEFIKITDFLDRFELILVSIYLPGQIVKSAILLFILCRGLALLLTGSREKPSSGGAHPPDPAAYVFAVPLGALGYAGASLFFHDTIELFPLNRVWPVLSAPFVLLLPLAMYVFLRPGRSSRRS